MNEDITGILEPLRKFTITGQSLEPKKEGFVLTHVNTFITLERKLALKSLKRKSKQQKKAKDKDVASDENDINTALTKEIIESAKRAVSDWEKAAQEVVNFIEEGKSEQVLDSLLLASNCSYVCKKGIVLCLVILIKRSKNVDIVAKCYSAVTQICKTTSLLMLFIELCKIYATANNKNSGWGRGMKRAIRNWYLHWEPHLLALEVTRFPSAYTWSHKDILKVAHINMKDLPTGSQTVLHYIFSGFESAKKAYENEENAKELLKLLEILHKGANEVINSQLIIERGNNILDKFGSISMNDFSSQALNDVKVLTFLLEKGSPQLIIDVLAKTNLFKLINSNADLRTVLIKQFQRENFANEVDLIRTIAAYNHCRRISANLIKEDSLKLGDSKEKLWLNNVPPNSDKTKKIRISVPRPKEINEFFTALSQVVSKGTRNIKKREKTTLVCVDIEPCIDGFVSVSPEDPISKEVKGTQAVSYLALALSPHSSLESVMPSLFQRLKSSNESETKKHCLFHFVHSGLSRVARTHTDCGLKVNESLQLALEKKVSTCVICCFKINKSSMDAIYTKFTQLKTEDDSLKLRLIVCSLDASERIDKSSFSHPDLLLLFGFNRYTLPIIQAFSEEQL